ncbi:PAS domain S-box protein [Candidatus Saccharibacteria bacterium]|nr:PAS domain S-box protein [Candidatus Saccharibacteria bacterium]
MFVSLIVAALYAAAFALPGSQVATLFPVDIITAGIAGLTFIVSLFLYIKPPAKKISNGTFVAYALLVATIASTVIATGESDSPLIGFWIAGGVFAGVFGWRGYAFILLLVAGYDAYTYSINPTALDSIIVASVASVAPLIASFIIWHSMSSKDEKHDKAYRQLASELSHESNKSDTVINAINDGVVSVDSKGVIQLINPAAQQIIGWGKADAVGLSYKSVVKLNDKNDKPIEPSVDPVSQVLASHTELRSDEFTVTTEAGKKILLSLVVSPIGAPSTGAIMVFRDITKEKSEEREQAEFISTASHEMRTPVASIEGYLGLTLNPAIVTIDDKARDYIQKAHESAQHLGRLFQDLLDVTKADDGRISNSPSVVDVVEYIGNVVEGLKPKAVEKGLTFVYKPTPDTESAGRTMAPVYYVHVDNDHLREVISNLVENAVKYTPKGDVVIDVGGDDTHVRVSVQDSGIGIPAEDIKHLFQKFYRVDNTDTREIGGTGLGLYLCRRLAELMGGSIKVESEYKKGSTFTLELPRIDHTEAQRLMDVSIAAKELAQSSVKSTAAVELPAFVPEELPVPPAPAQPLVFVTPEPAPVPIAQPAQVAAQPAYVAPRTPVTPQAPNIPLSQLEQNPTAYVAPRAPMQIPVRGPEETKQA